MDNHNSKDRKINFAAIYINVDGHFLAGIVQHRYS